MQIGEPGILQAVTFFGLFQENFFFWKIESNIFYDFFKKCCDFKNIGLYKTLGLFVKFCLLYCVCGVQLQKEPSPLLKVPTLLRKMANMEAFKNSRPLEYFICHFLEYLDQTTSKIFSKSLWLQKHRAPKTITSFCHILCFVLCV